MSQHDPFDSLMHRAPNVVKNALNSMAVSKEMVAAAQSVIERPYPFNQEYGISDEDMAKAIKAALVAAAKRMK